MAPRGEQTVEATSPEGVRNTVPGEQEPWSREVRSQTRKVGNSSGPERTTLDLWEAPWARGTCTL